MVSFGIGNDYPKSNLAYANKNRDWRMYAIFLSLLMADARKIGKGCTDFKFKNKDNVYPVYSATIYLCLGVFDGQNSVKTKGKNVPYSI